MTDNIKTIRLVISQPPVSKTASEWDCTREQMTTFINRVSALARDAFAAVEGRSEPELTPGEKQCRYCPAKLDCPAYAELVANTALDGLKDLTDPVVGVRDVPIDPETLAAYYLKVGMIRKWCDAVEEAALERAERGDIGEAHGLKRVLGRKGNRAWANADEAEAMLKSFQMKRDEMYDFKIISPTTAEKLLAEASPRRWKKIAPLITQSEGAVQLVPLSDKRAAIPVVASASGFDADIDDLI